MSERDRKYEVRPAGKNWAVVYVWGEFGDYHEILEADSRFSAQMMADILQTWYDAGVLL